MQISWDINLASLFTITLAALGFARYCIQNEQKANSAEKRAAEAEAQARLAHEKIALLQASINAREITQAERLVSRDVLREVEERLSRSIDQLGHRFEGLGEKLDGFVKELISHRKGGG